MPKSSARRRANGEGSITEDKARGRWRGFVSWTDPDGTPRRKSVSAPTAEEVRRKVTKLRADLDVGVRPAAGGTVGEFLDVWLVAERARVRASTWRYRDGHVRLYIKPAIGGRRLADLTPRDVETMTADMLGRGLAPRSAAGCRTTLRKALADAVRDGLVPRNVAALARPPRVPGREVEYLTRAELRKLLDAIEGDPLAPLVSLAALTGLRQGELLALRWSDIDTAGARLTVRQSMARDWSGGFSLAEPKTTRSRRTVHLPAQAVAALDAQRVAQDGWMVTAGADAWSNVDDLVFTDEAGRPLVGRNVTRAFSKMLTAAKVRHVSFHALRHSWATLALSQGVPLKVVADNLGHASIVVTAAFYSGIVPELNRDAADAIGRALA